MSICHKQRTFFLYSVPYTYALWILCPCLPINLSRQHVIATAGDGDGGNDVPVAAARKGVGLTVSGTAHHHPRA